jgi:predicted nicotinamide N-methyase
MLHTVLEKRLFLAPALLDGGAVLDIGTGTGIWSVEMADEDGSRTVWGVDMTPIQPIWVPPNARFEIWDLEKEQYWTHQDPFKLIFGRQLGGCIKDWKNLVRRCYE